MTQPSTVTSTISAEGLIDTIDRLLECGAAITGDVIIGVADIDLIRVDLRALVLGVVSSGEELP